MTIEQEQVEPVEPTITSGDKNYSISALPEDLQRLIKLYQLWEEELEQAKIQVFKIEAAIRGLGMELEGRIRQVSEE